LENDHGVLHVLEVNFLVVLVVNVVPAAELEGLVLENLIIVVCVSVTNTQTIQRLPNYYSNYPLLFTQA